MPDPDRRLAAMRAAAYALDPIMDREGLERLHRIAAAELARVAIEAYERAMADGERWDA